MLEEDEGVKAIQALLKMSGQTEPEEVSRANWNKMNDHAKIQTEAAYNMFCKPKDSE